MKWSELKRIAENKGWRLKRHGKKHDIYYYPDKIFSLRWKDMMHKKLELEFVTKH